MLYMVTFTINIPQMLAYIPYMDPMGIIYIYIFKTRASLCSSKAGSHLQGQQFRELGRWTPSQGIQTAQRGHLWRRRLKGRMFFFSVGWKKQYILYHPISSYIILYHPISSYIILHHPISSSSDVNFKPTLLWRLHFVICCLHGTESCMRKKYWFT